MPLSLLKSHKREQHRDPQVDSHTPTVSQVVQDRLEDSYMATICCPDQKVERALLQMRLPANITEAKPLKQIERHYGPLPWKPRVDLTSPVMIQCQMRVVEICGKYLSLALVAKDKQMKKSSLIFLHELLSNSSVGTITVNNEFFKDHTRAWK